LRAGAPEPWVLHLGRAIGTIAITVGLILVGLILYASIR